MDAKEFLEFFETVDSVLDGANIGIPSSEHIRNTRAAVADAYERLDALERECEGLRLELAAGAEWERARVAEAALAANVARAADYRDQLLAALERAASAESEFHAVYAYLWKVAPWSESNEMDWADEMICGIDLLLQRAETAEAALAAANARADAMDPELLPYGKHLCIPFGVGAVAVSTGTHDGVPCVLLRQLPIPGEVGQTIANDAGPLRAALLFPTPEQAHAVMDALVLPAAKGETP
jgi:hypothetical protein